MSALVESERSLLRTSSSISSKRSIKTRSRASKCEASRTLASSEVRYVSWEGSLSQCSNCVSAFKFGVDEFAAPVAALAADIARPGLNQATEQRSYARDEGGRYDTSVGPRFLMRRYRQNAPCGALTGIAPLSNSFRPRRGGINGSSPITAKGLGLWVRGQNPSVRIPSRKRPPMPP